MASGRQLIAHPLAGEREWVAALNRERAIRRIQRRLTDRGWPKLQVSAAFLVAGLVAFSSSYALLQLGLADMAVRYVIAASLAYVAFLLLLRFFVSAIRRGTSADVDPLDALEIASSGDSSKSSDNAPPADDCADPSSAEPLESISDLPIPDLDEGLAILVPLLVLGAGIVSAIYVVYVAPVLLAELILDVVIASSLARRFERIPSERWYYGALRHTYKPFLGVLATVALAGFLGGLFAPEADSIGDIFRSS